MCHTEGLGSCAQRCAQRHLPLRDLLRRMRAVRVGLPPSGIGSGIDSFYEYQFKAFMLFGETDFWFLFNEVFVLFSF